MDFLSLAPAVENEREVILPGVSVLTGVGGSERRPGIFPPAG